MVARADTSVMMHALTLTRDLDETSFHAAMESGRLSIRGVRAYLACQWLLWNEIRQHAHSGLADVWMPSMCRLRLLGEDISSFGGIRPGDAGPVFELVRWWGDHGGTDESVGLLCLLEGMTLAGPAWAGHLRRCGFGRAVRSVNPYGRAAGAHFNGLNRRIDDTVRSRERILAGTESGRRLVVRWWDDMGKEC